MDADARVALEGIRGDVKLVLERQGRTNEDVRDLKDRVHGHSNRLQILEVEKHQRAGAIATAKWLWAAAGVSGTGLAAIIMRHLGV